MTTLSELEQIIKDFNKDAETFKLRRDALVELAVEAGLSRRHVAKVLASVTVKMPEAEAPVAGPNPVRHRPTCRSLDAIKPGACDCKTA